MDAFTNAGANRLLQKSNTDAFTAAIAYLEGELISRVIGPLLLIALLFFAFISLLLNKIPAATIIGMHLSVFVFASFTIIVSMEIKAKLVALSLALFLCLRGIGGFFMWLGRNNSYWWVKQMMVLIVLAIACFAVFAVELEGKLAALDRQRTLQENANIQTALNYESGYRY